MGTDTVSLSKFDAAEIDRFLDSVGYECDLIVQDTRDRDELRAFHFRRIDNARNQVALSMALEAAGAGEALIPRATYDAICADLAWLAEEWLEARKAMDETDRANYDASAAHLDALRTRLGSR